MFGLKRNSGGGIKNTMKIRTDFVTNSSSSSFILGFTSEEDMISELINGFPKWAIDKVGIVIKDILDAKRMSEDEVINNMRYNYEYDAYEKIYSKYRKTYGVPYTEAAEYMDTEEAEKAIRNEIDEFVAEHKGNIKNKSIFVEVEYSDNDGEQYSALEHEIMPIIESTIVSFNHH